MNTYISQRMGQFAYFNHQLDNPDWTGKKVLDFGGNVGNMLLDPNCRIEPANYWSIDVVPDAITEGRRRHPQAHFICYDRYNFEYNPTGTVDLPIPDPGVQFDFIVAWSVVTHNSKTETLDLVGQLTALLADDGRLVFSFLDPLWTPPPGWVRDVESPGLSNLHYWLEKGHGRIDSTEMDVAGALADAESTALTWVSLLNGNELILDPDDDGLSEDKPQRTYLSFCTPEYMSRLFPYARIRPPVKPERHHCAIIDANKVDANKADAGETAAR